MADFSGWGMLRLRYFDIGRISAVGMQVETHKSSTVIPIRFYYSVLNAGLMPSLKNRAVKGFMNPLSNSRVGPEALCSMYFEMSD